MFKDKKIMAGGAVLFAAAFWFYIKPNYMDPPAVVIPPSAEEIAASPRPTVILGKPLPAGGGHGGGSSNAPEGLVLNLKAPASAPNYVKTIIALEFEQPTPPWLGIEGAKLEAKNAEFAHHLQPEMHKIMDSVTTVFASKSVDDLSTIEGREHLKAELIEAINHHMHGLKVEKVYFEMFITQ
ncbi:MAG TPA: flagellar basal body-associated FliL family protein [Tepidiformaceae bacterium]|nr:flagellar basal body-associated FliL family protein [Tepidiformaceae bacterium]